MPVWLSTPVVYSSCALAGIVELRQSLCHCAAVSLNAERKRRNVEQKHIADAVIENVCLHRRAERDDFIGVQFGVRYAIEKSRTVLRISGVRAVPPTSTTSSISSGFSPASASASFTGPMV